MSSSPRMRTSARKDWPESFLNGNDIGNEEKHLDRCLTSLAGSGPHSAGLCSTTSNGCIVEELTFRNHRNPNSALVSHTLSSRLPQINQSGNESECVNSSRETAPKDEENISDRLSKETRGNASNFWSLKSLSSKKMNYDPEKIAENIGNGDKTMTLSNALLVSTAMQDTSSTYNFSPLVLKQKLKGKGVVCKDAADNSVEPHGAFIGKEDKTPAFMAKSHSDTLLRPNSAAADKPLQKFVMSSVESSNNGINLRELLISSGHKISKQGRLHIFKQILEFVNFAHSQGVVLQHLRPSCFTLLPSNKVKYTGSLVQGELYDVPACNTARKRPMEEDFCSCLSLGAKQQKLHEIKSIGQRHCFRSICACRTKPVNLIDSFKTGSMGPLITESVQPNSFRHQHSTDEKQIIDVTAQLEEKWYSSLEVLNDGGCTFSSNIYRLGVLLFELLCNIESWEVHSEMMLDLHQRILPPKFLSENPKEAGFCLWLLHPEPSSRPTTRMISESEIFRDLVKLNSQDDDILVSDDDEAETEQLIYFLTSLREGKERQTAKLAEELSCLEEDIKEVERRYSLGAASLFPMEKNGFSKFSRNSSHLQDPFSSDISRSIQASCVNEARFMRNINQLETAYFSMRSWILLTEDAAVAPYDKDVLKSRWRLSQAHNDNEEQRIKRRSTDRLGSFFEGLCKFARYSKFEECGILRSQDLLNSSNVMCALSFDRDEDYIAAAGVSKKIKIFDVSAISSNSIDMQYPIVEMSNKSKLSCVCWNSYIKSHLASTDYDGVVQMWDADTGQPFSQYMEHQKRAWSVHFSQSDPKMFASGSDDCSVKLWNISERNSIGTIWNPANVCCVQFSSYSTNLLVFGSADYKIYGYDLRHTRIPWCTLSGHGKAVSYVKFLDSETLASASTDSSLKLWDLKKTSSSGLSSGACSLTFKGHTNEKNFVGLSVVDGYVACGSETNEVYCYHRSLPVPITSYKFGSIDPISGQENIDDGNGQFVSSVCWRKKSGMLVAANSIGAVKLLKMV
ncbi:protein SUPPRESSOR OF PHYA-105 1 [Neltuma alba]|uniref:protein SUPPRESSOR OF PHYA-105 1 n=1 Tax=Neltuma alba TaxID=207710 RepID=UPI0010A58308|nr:protein SUPPRESSOR OF PHYA-105 1-like [Prosopis alba]XP_028794768.1 protein SUPPRESSOR OF PHYA-105 1-like [Prosopis alba]XP_028794769.1 protein SUPPRESSOR OF PHYA-105 1-like [Prosopis alba]XP_028794770.1 protein SUPPRESSOR OF PHYA-105 1-like [Prosopis alba]XP_028794771.1 protein SUPPRESSOR OF PHYA-105 1-like [Prosopis alba]XP_028794772.1 protein SUPPRESSOR OF PHYA-105 1-like [Prosopis alba]XP_028794773.1 protein SUPPRESSOR OF PHYA-105 1-like [Prosopis alba]XP_028794774.1 protein SUPPRESSO